MAEKSETGVGTQIVVALVLLFAAWVVLKWVVRAVAFVVNTVIVLGLLAVAAWLFLGRQNRSSQ